MTTTMPTRFIPYHNAVLIPLDQAVPSADACTRCYHEHCFVRAAGVRSCARCFNLFIVTDEPDDPVNAVAEQNETYRQALAQFRAMREHCYELETDDRDTLDAIDAWRQAALRAYLAATAMVAAGKAAGLVGKPTVGNDRDYQIAQSWHINADATYRRACLRRYADQQANAD